MAFKNERNVYYHFTCNSRRESIRAYGLMSGFPESLNADQDGDEYMDQDASASASSRRSTDIFFVRFPTGYTQQDEIDRRSAQFVLCMVLHTCSIQRMGLDVWKFKVNRSDGNVVIPHTLEGEYLLNSQHNSSQVSKWSRQIAAVRVPSERLLLVSHNRLPYELSTLISNPGSCDIITSL